jgi:hypothetical protein
MKAQDFSFFIFHFSFAISEFKLEVAFRVESPLNSSLRP